MKMILSGVVPVHYGTCVPMAFRENGFLVLRRFAMEFASQWGSMNMAVSGAAPVR